MRLPDRPVVSAFLLAAGLAAAAPAPGHQAATREPPAIRLFGVLRQQETGVALLQFGEGRPLALRVGESHRGFKVLRVFAGGVQLRAPDRQVLELDLPEAPVPPETMDGPAAPETDVETPLPAEPPSGSEPTPPSPPPIGAPAPSDSRDGGERTFFRDDVRLRLQSELPRILSSAVVAPRVLGNEVVGLELVTFPTDTVLGETGLVPGDVLLAVNGREVRGAESLAVLVQRFQTASQIELSVDRDGEVFPLRYRIE